MASKKRGLAEEPSTLVYTLLSSSPLPFEHMSLMVRSLHTYMVEEIKEYADKKCVHVKLGYQASIKNTTKKMGGLAKHVTLTKLSTYVKDDELSLLDTLRRQYGLGMPSNEEEEAGPSQRKFKKARGYIKNSAASEEDSE